MEQERYTEQFTLHMSPRQKAILKRAAKKRRVSLGEVLRNLVDGLETDR